MTWMALLVRKCLFASGSRSRAAVGAGFSFSAARAFFFEQHRRVAARDAEDFDQALQRIGQLLDIFGAELSKRLNDLILRGGGRRLERGPTRRGHGYVSLSPVLL